MLVDSHCHLDFPELAGDLDGVLARARAAGVLALQTISTRLTEFARVRAIANEHEDVWCSVGIHPHHVAEEPPACAETLAALAKHPKVIGIGETGLDFHYKRSPREAQETSFRIHIAAAREAGLPVVVHSRGADEETLRILDEEMGKGAFAGVIHCFSTGRGLAEGALALGLHLSLAGIVTFKNAEELRAVARDLPPERLLIETDAPYLAPVPKRGQSNEPAFLVHTAERLAGLVGLSPEALGEATSANFFRLFAKARPPAGWAGP